VKEFLIKIISAIVNDPTQVEVIETEENGLKIYTILAPEEEVGKIIGKEGKVINAIRCLARLKALRAQERVLVKVEPRTI